MTGSEMAQTYRLMVPPFSTALDTSPRSGTLGSISVAFRNLAENTWVLSNFTEGARKNPRRVLPERDGGSLVDLFSALTSWVDAQHMPTVGHRIIRFEELMSRQNRSSVEEIPLRIFRRIQVNTMVSNRQNSEE